MAETKRKLSELLGLYADNSSGQITAQDLRDGFESSLGSLYLTQLTSNTTLSADDVFVEAITSGSDITITLPSVSGSDGFGDSFKSKFYIFYNNGSNNLIVSASNGLIQNNSSYTIQPYRSLSLFSNGNELLIYSISTNSNYDSVLATVSATSGNWNSVYNTVYNTSAFWQSVYSSVLANSATWNSVYNSVNTTSGNWNQAYSNLLSNSATWNSVYNSVNTTSSNWNQSYSNLQSNSATWNNTNSVLQANSAIWNNGNSAVNNLVINTSANWNSVYNSINATSGNWNQSYSNLQSNSATWNNTNTVVQSNSAIWNNGNSAVNNLVINTSANWNSVYNSVNTTSANWNNSYSTVNSNSANWNNSYSTVNSNSANWNNAYLSASTYLNQGVTTSSSPTFNTISANNIYGTISASTNNTISGSGSQASPIGLNVTAVDHNKLLNYDVQYHRSINDSGTGSTDLWSANKIISQLATKSDTSHNHTLASLGDVTITIPTNGQTLIYSSASNRWINQNDSGSNAANGGVTQTVDLASCTSLFDFETTSNQYPYFSYVPISFAANSVDRITIYVYSKDPGSIDIKMGIYQNVGNVITLLTSGTKTITTTGFNTISLITPISLNVGNIYYSSILKQSTSAMSLVADTCLPISNISFKGASVNSPYVLSATQGTMTATDTTIWALLYSSTSVAATATSVSGVNSFTIKSVSADYNANFGEFIKVYSTSGNIVVNTPDPAAYTGYSITVKKMSNDTNTVILSANNSWSIEQTTSAGIHNQYTSITVVSDGSSWLIS